MIFSFSLSLFSKHFFISFPFNLSRSISWTLNPSELISHRRSPFCLHSKSTWRLFILRFNDQKVKGKTRQNCFFCWFSILITLFDLNLMHFYLSEFFVLRLMNFDRFNTFIDTMFSSFFWRNKSNQIKLPFDQNDDDHHHHRRLKLNYTQSVIILLASLIFSPTIAFGNVFTRFILFGFSFIMFSFFFFFGTIFQLNH